MRKTFGMNKHQKAAHKAGERHVGREQVEELLAMSCSADPEERLVAAQYLCPCHVRTRIPAVWEALFRMMEDADARVRRAAWHTLVDGGQPKDPEAAAALERILLAEPDPKVRKFAEWVFRKAIGPLPGTNTASDWLAGRSVVKQRGKCDFCGATDVPVDFDTQTLIPTETHQRAALICERCAQGLA